jgi:hypothetical protein
MIAVSPSVVLTPPFGSLKFNANNPLIGWRSLLDPASVSSDEEADGHPIANIANPSTYQKWRGLTSGAQAIEILLGGLEPVDYLGVAGHNLSQRPITIYGATEFGIDSTPNWVEIGGPVILPTDETVLFRFEKAHYLGLRIELGVPVQEDVIPELAVAYVGELLVLPRRLYVGHAPLNLNRDTDVRGGFSDRGQFLGRIILSETSRSEIAMSNIPPAYYRQRMEPWVAGAIVRPFFFAWRPEGYPREVGYCWATGNASVSNVRGNGFMQFSMPLEGIVA